MPTNPTERRRQILNTALASFSAAGYHDTSMNDIAESLSITKPVVYQFFESKRALYLEVLQFVGDDLVSTVTDAVRGSDNPYTQTEAGMISYFTWAAENRPSFALLYESSARVDTEFADITSEFQYSLAQAIAPFISANVSTDDQVTFAIGLVGMAETVTRQVLRQGRDFDPQSLGRTLASFAWGGLRSVGEPNTQ